MHDIDRLILKAIVAKTPRMFEQVRGRVPGFPHFREVDAGLQRLRRAGKIKYLKKAEGGPGWIRA